jgi:hypothetical protein
MSLAQTPSPTDADRPKQPDQTAAAGGARPDELETSVKGSDHRLTRVLGAEAGWRWACVRYRSNWDGGISVRRPDRRVRPSGRGVSNGEGRLDREAQGGPSFPLAIAVTTHAQHEPAP